MSAALEQHCMEKGIDYKADLNNINTWVDSLFKDVDPIIRKLKSMTSDEIDGLSIPYLEWLAIWIPAQMFSISDLLAEANLEYEVAKFIQKDRINDARSDITQSKLTVDVRAATAEKAGAPVELLSIYRKAVYRKIDGRMTALDGLYNAAKKVMDIRKKELDRS